MSDSRTTDQSERLFTFLAKAILPADFQLRFLDELLLALRSRYRETTAQKAGAFTSARFWALEILGLFATAARERREQIRDSFRPSNSKERPGFSMSSILQDIKFALRSIFKSPLVSLIAVLSLAVGIAANVTVFSLANSWLLRPLEYPDAEEIVIVWANDVQEVSNQDGLSPAEYFHWLERSSSWKSIFALRFDEMNLVGVDRPERFNIASVTSNFFTTVGVPASLGGTFDESQLEAGGQRMAVLSDQIWRDRYDRSPDVVGREIRFNGETFSIAGVMPETFDFLLGDVAAWVSTDFLDERDTWDDRSLLVTGRLADGISLEVARSESEQIFSELAPLHPETNRDFTANLVPIQDQFPSATDKALVSVLLLIVFLVFVGASINISGLLLARADGRQREMAIRIALGAGTGRLLRLMGIEAVLLATAAGSLGALLGSFGVRGIAMTIPPMLPSQMFPKFDGNVILFTIVASLAGAITFGLPPARHAILGARSNRVTDWTRGSVGTRSSKRLRSFFVVTQFAVALTILVSAGVLTDMMKTRMAIDPGLDPSNLLSVEMTVPEFNYPDDEALVGFYSEVTAQLNDAIGTGHTFTSALPRSTNIPNTGFRPTDLDPADEDWPRTSWMSVAASYFETVKLPTLQGRVFELADRAETAPVVVVNRRFAEIHYPDQDVVGKRIEIRGAERTIIGLTPNVAQARLTGLLPYEPIVYFPLEQNPVRTFAILARSAGDPTVLTSPIREAVSRADPDQPIANVMTVEEYMAFQVSAMDAIGILLMIVGLLALGLSVMGIYGILAYHVSQQTAEIGIRMALGARPRKILAGILKHGGAIAGVGLALGTPLAILVVYMIGSTFTNNGDGLNIEGGIAVGAIILPVVVLLAVGFVACVLPARKATRIDPAEALRAE